MLTSADVGNTNRVVVTPNTEAGRRLRGDRGDRLRARPPDSAPPTVSGTPTEGQTLIAADGTWAGAPTDRVHVRVVAL